ncbi:MAG TPA: hypothetical protein VM219_10195 [Phycisphaerae bacterium]|nr:hypothetical protein [Phycisphaerae bacterium]
MVGARGLELSNVTPSKNRDLRDSQNASGAECGAEKAICEPIDPDLQRVIDAWPNLPEAVKAGIVAMVRASGSDRTP